MQRTEALGFGKHPFFFFSFFLYRIVCWLVGVAVVVSWVSDVALDR